MNFNMNILIISNIELDTKNASGNTYANWLSDWSDSKIACIYARDSFPNNDFCDEYYSVSPFSMLKHFWKPWKIGRHFFKNDIPKDNSSLGKRERSLVRHSKHSNNRRYVYLLNDILFKSRIWLNSKYKDFIREFNPDIVLYFAKSDAFLVENLKYIKRNTSAKCVAFYADDVYRRFQNQRGLIYRIFEKRFHDVVKLADMHLGASILMCKDYGNLFGIKMTPFYKGCDISETSTKVNTPIKIVYAGNLYYGREITLFKIAEAIKQINIESEQIRLYIYTGAEITEEINNKLNISGVSQIYDSRPYEEIKQIMRSADIVLHVESFKEEHIKSVRLSYSTKISDCLQSGSMLLAVGPRNIASIEEAIVFPGATVITDEHRIFTELKEIVRNKKQIPQQATLTNLYAKEKFPLDIIRNTLKNEFSNLINGYEEN